MGKKPSNVKYVKHRPPKQIWLRVEYLTTFQVKSTTPFISGIKKVQKLLQQFEKSSLSNRKYQQGDFKKVKYIKIKGMGKAIEKTLSLGLKFQDDMHYKVDIITGTIELLDEFQIEDIDDTSVVTQKKDEVSFRKRNISCVEVRIWLKRE